MLTQVVRGIILFLLLMTLVGCSSMHALRISFADPIWDGITIPNEGLCKKCGGDGLSPALIVDNVPTGTNTLVVEFNDRDYRPLSKNGGHGAIWVEVANTDSVFIPSISEMTFQLPQGVNIEHKHKAPIGAPGAYIGPYDCRKGGNRFFANVKAICRLSSSEDRLLGEGQIELGQP